MINLHCGKRRKVALIKEEQFEQVLVPETSAEDHSRALVQKYNAIVSKGQQLETDFESRPDAEKEETIEEKRLKYLDHLQKVLIEFDTLSRTTDMLKSKQHLSLQACDRPATSFRNPPVPPSALLASRQADLRGCRGILAKGLVQSKEVSSGRRLFALDCLALRRHWKLVLSSSFSTATSGLVGAGKEPVVTTRIGKEDFLAVDCSYATAGDAYDENWFTKVNRHLPFIVQLSIGDMGAMLRNPHTTRPLLHEKERGVTDGPAPSSALSTLKFSLQHRDDIAQQWLQVASDTSYNTLRVNNSNQRPQFYESRSRRESATDCQPREEARQISAKPNLLDMMEMEDSESDSEEEQKKPPDSTDQLDAIHEHCNRVQHDQFCRRMFEVLLAEALKPRDEGGFMVSDQHLHPAAERPDAQQAAELQMQPLTVSQATRKMFISSLQVVAASRSSVSVALSPTLSLSISLEKQCISTSSRESDSNGFCNNPLQQCLRQCIISVDALRLSRFEKSRRVAMSPTSAADAFRNRFPSLRGENNDGGIGGVSGVSLLQHAQQELQKQLWKLRLEEMVKMDDMAGVRCSWVKRVGGNSGGANEEVAVLEMKTAGDLNGINYAAGDIGPRKLVLRLHPTFIEAESISGADASVPLLRFSTDALVERHVKKWMKQSR